MPDKAARLALEKRGSLNLPPNKEHLLAVLGALGAPQLQIPSVHIAGTNGKGSTAAMLESVLRCAGNRTGLFTSPHLSHIEERIRVNGEDISATAFDACCSRVLEAEQGVGIQLNYFAFLTAMAFYHFAASGAEITILEAGLGGRLDPTNCIPCPETAIITRIGMDHMNLLGDTIEKIAAEKAGIIKEGIPLILAAQTPAAEAIVCQIAARMHARLYKADDSLLADYADNIGLHGAYQYENAATALTALTVLQKKGWRIPAEAIRKGLSITRWPARFSLLHANPAVILDGAHNPQGAEAFARSLGTAYPNTRCVFVMGCMRDKQYESCIRAVSGLARCLVAVPVPAPRALPAAELAAAMRCHAPHADVYAANSIAEGLELGLSLLLRDEPLCVFGSLYMADAVMRWAAQLS